MPIEQDAYDAVAYPGYPYPRTHPDRLAVMATLYGLDPAPVESCRVLEIGCNEGANLIPMAYAIPGSEFVGFDLAGQPIARGQQRIRELGLTNIRLFQADLTQIDGVQSDLCDGETLGKFDYIIAHGLYAWVPEPARDRLLALCHERLAPNGIAFVSYNALPGGHVRNMVRDILLHHAAGAEDLEQGVRHGLDLLELIAQARSEGDPIRGLLEQETKLLQVKNLQAMYHDELGSEYHPVLFSTFAAHAAKHGLQYMSESMLPPPNDEVFRPEIAGMAKALGEGDPIAEEQILDFARMRMYRETLLCHAGCTVARDLKLEAFGRLRLSSRAESSPGEEAGVHGFAVAGGVRIQTQDKTTIALMERLIEAWPQSVPFAELVEFLEEKAGVPDEEVPALLSRLVVSRVIELHAWSAPVSSRIAARPMASAVSRQEAAAHARATTLLHFLLGLEDPTVRGLLLLLDGTRDREDLVRALRKEYPEMPEAKLEEGIVPALRFLHRSGALLREGFR